MLFLAQHFSRLVAGAQSGSCHRGRASQRACPKVWDAIKDFDGLNNGIQRLRPRSSSKVRTTCQVPRLTLKDGPTSVT